MSRWAAGSLVGLITGAITVALGFTGGLVYWAGPAIALLAGLLAGFLIGRNPKFAGRTAVAGLLAGLIAGGFLLIAQIIAGGIAATQVGGFGNQVVDVIRPTLEAQATATAAAGGTPADVNATLNIAIATVGASFGCVSGIVSMLLALGMGAAGGAIGGRGNLPTQMPPGMPGYGGYPQQPGPPYAR